jgi:uncharacterized membrane protein YjjB (DUF3815 family)
MFILKVTAVFAMSLAIGALYRIPRELVIFGGIIGVVSWLVMAGCIAQGIGMGAANFFGSMAVGILAEVLARHLKKPATVFVIPGFIPLVPGGQAYSTMLFLVEGKQLAAVSMGFETMLLAGAIASGIFLGVTVYQLTSTALGKRAK